MKASEIIDRYKDEFASCKTEEDARIVMLKVMNEYAAFRVNEALINLIKDEQKESLENINTNGYNMETTNSTL